MSDNSKEKSAEVKPEDMTFRNEAVKTIKALQYENAKLKDYVGRKQKQERHRSRQRGGSGIVGLKGLSGFRTK